MGRPLGVLGGVALGVALGLHLPASLKWREVIVVALATTSGFSFALFAAASLLPLGAVLTQIKVGALATRPAHWSRLAPRVCYASADSPHLHCRCEEESSWDTVSSQGNQLPTKSAESPRISWNSPLHG